MTLRPLASLLLVLLAGAPARAAPGADRELLRWPLPALGEGPSCGATGRPWLPLGEASPLRPIQDWKRALPGPGEPAGPETESQEPDHVPRIRLEAYLRVVPLVRSKVKHGPAALAHGWDTSFDARLPDVPTLGQRWLIDLRIHRWLTVGVAWSQVVVDGPRRSVHYRGISHATTYFPPDSRVSTTVDVQTGEAWVRLVVSDDLEHVRFAIGVGAVWASHRTTVHRGDLGAGGRVETFFTPTMSYLLAVHLGSLPASVFIESVTAPFAPWRFPSVFSETRAGLRISVGAGLELIASASFSSGQIEDSDDLWGGRPRPGKRFKVATWYVPAAEFGVAWTFG